MHRNNGSLQHTLYHDRGIEAVVWTDAIQVIILLGGALLLWDISQCQFPRFCWKRFLISAADGKFSLGSTGFDLQDSTMWTVLIAAFFTNLTTYGTDQSMVQRYLTTPSQSAAKRVCVTNALLYNPCHNNIFFDRIFTICILQDIPRVTEHKHQFRRCRIPPVYFHGTPGGSDRIADFRYFCSSDVDTFRQYEFGGNRVYSGYLSSDNTARCRVFAGSQFATCVTGLISLAFAFLMATWNIASLWDEFRRY